MTDIVNWSKVAAENTMQPPDGLPEHCLPSAVNDWARETMAAVRRWYGNTSLNVMNFGAVGDGVADDTAAIQSAVTEAADKSLFFPPGNYLIRGSITLPDASLRLFGDAATITADEAINWPFSIVGSGFIGDSTPDLHEYIFDNLGFTWHVGGTGSILFLPSPTILTIQNCTSTGGTTFAQISDGNVINFNNNTIANFDAFGLYLNGDCAFARITNNHFVTTDTPLQPLTTCVYYSGVKSDNTGGLAYATIIANNHFRILASEGIGVWVNPHPADGGSVDLIINNNQFYANGLSAYGVFVGGSLTAHNIQVLSNYFEGATTTAAMTQAVVIISPANNIQIINNMANAWDAGTQGVFNFTGNHGIVAGNMGNGCSSPFILTSGTDIQLIGNSDGVALSDIDITGRYKSSGHTLASTNGQYTLLHTPTSAENIAIYLGNQIDPTNYYRNTIHQFQDIAPTITYAVINSSGISTIGLFNTGTSVLNGTITGNNANFSGAVTANAATIAAGLAANTLAITGTSVLNGTITANSANFAQNVTIGADCSVAAAFGAANISASNAIAIGEGLSLGTNHVSDFAMFTNVSNGDTTLQLGSGSFFTLVRSTGRVQLWVGGVFQQQWPA